MSTPHQLSTSDQLYREHYELIQKVIDRVARRRQLRGADGEDFAGYVHEKLLDNDCGRLRRYQGASKFSTFVTTVVMNLSLDYLDKTRGKWRSSAAARDLGPVGIRLEELLVRDGRSADEAVEQLLRNERVELSRQRLHDMAARLGGRARRSFEGPQALLEMPSPEPDARQRLEEQERLSRVGRIFQDLQEDMADLTAEDRVLVRMRFQTGLQVKTIVGILGGEPKAYYRRLERLKRRLDQALKKRGYSADDLD